MTKAFIATPKRTKDILHNYGFSFKKSLGQNFIVDANLLERMLESVDITSSSGVIEIGPGIGSLTEQLAIHSKQVLAYEIDQRLLPILEDTLSDYDNIEIVHQDILQANLHEAIAHYFTDVTDVHVVANLPYYITTPILMYILQQGLPIQSMTVMLQKEVAERMAAVPNTKAYGSLSIAVQYYTEATLLMDVPKTAFIPQPNVVSSILKLERRKTPPVQVHNEKQFFEIVKACFVHRRKTLRNNLLSHFKASYGKEVIHEILEKTEIDGTRRGESLTMHEFANLANAFYVITHEHR